LREAGAALKIRGENRVDAAKPGGLRGGVDLFEVRLLRGIGSDKLRPYRLIARRVVSLAFLNMTEDVVECRACRGNRSIGRRRSFRCCARSSKMDFLLGGKCASESLDGKIVDGVMFVLLGKLRVGKRLNARTELAQEKVNGEIESSLARLKKQLTLVLKPELAVTTSLDSEVRLTGGTVADHALESLGLDTSTLTRRFQRTTQG